jgi:RNA recognition motif-containing protein
MNIYVGNLPYQTTEEDLRSAFAEYGEVSKVNIVKDRFSGESRGFGFVEMASDDEGQAAISALDGREYQGRTLKINEARPREDRPRRQP